MVWVEHNIDAYRILAEVLRDLRKTLSKSLTERHGSSWHKTAMPGDVFSRLVARKERERAIDWYESDYMELIEFASFSDLLDIMDANPGAIPNLSQLVPAPSLLHARFLELEVIRHKLGMCRPISETELSFLGTFHMRFRRAMEAPAEAPSDESGDDADFDEEEYEDDDEDAFEEVEVDEGDPDDDQEEPWEPDSLASASQEPVVPPPAEGVGEPPRAPVSAINPPPTNEVLPPEPPAHQTPVPGTAVPVPEPESPDSTRLEPTMIGSRGQLGGALESGDHKTILRDLYQEVTEIAEGMWTSEVPVPSRSWETVCIHEWYQENFSKLGLKPLSDFYGIISQVNEKMGEGIARDELQDFLKNANFAQVLLALRDMFQRNNI